jgi:serine/threonine protein kinase
MSHCGGTKVTGVSQDFAHAGLSRFEIIRTLGRGGFGEVFLAEDRLLSRRVTIKQYYRSLDELKLIDLALRQSSELQHSGLSQVFDLIVTDDKLFAIQSYVKGETLCDRLTDAALTFSERLDIFQNIASVVSYLHSKSRLHCDINSRNVLVDANGHSVLIDLDHCLKIDHQLSGLRRECGTRPYMAPELFTSNAAQSIATEVYALGALLLELIVRLRLEDNQGLTKDQFIDQLEKDVSNGRYWAAILRKAMNAVISQRYNSVDAMIADVRGLRTGKTIVAKPFSRRDKLILWANSHRLLFSLSVASASFILLGTTATAIAWQQSASTLRRLESQNRQLDEKLQVERGIEDEQRRLVLQTKSIVQSAEQAENEQQTATGAAQEAYERLTSENEKTKQLRETAEQTLRDIEASEIVREDVVDKSRVLVLNLDLLRAENEVANYAFIVKRIWANVRLEKWRDATQLLGELDPRLGHFERSWLEAAIGNRMSQPKRVVLGKIEKARLDKVETLGGQRTIYRDNSVTRSFHCEFQGWNGRVSLKTPLPRRIADEAELLWFSLDEKLPMDLLAILPDGTMLLSAQNQRRSQFVEIIAWTYSPGNYSYNPRIDLNDLRSLAEKQINLVAD